MLELSAVGDGDDSAFYDAWVAAGDTYNAEAESTLASGHRASARGLFLRASCLYAAAYHPLFGTPVDPRLLKAFDKQMAACAKTFRACAKECREMAKMAK